MNSIIAPVVVIRPILPRKYVNHSAPSGPVVIPPLFSGEIVNSVIAPVVVIRPTLPPTPSVNHKAPSGPVVMPSGPGGPGSLISISCKFSAVAVIGMRPILFDVNSVNHSAPSGPVVMECKMPPPLIGNSVMPPWVVIRPIFPTSVNHSAPSGPAVIAEGRLAGAGNRRTGTTKPRGDGQCATAPRVLDMAEPRDAQSVTANLVSSDTTRGEPRFVPRSASIASELAEKVTALGCPGSKSP